MLPLVLVCTGKGEAGGAAHSEPIEGVDACVWGSSAQLAKPCHMTGISETPLNSRAAISVSCSGEPATIHSDMLAAAKDYRDFEVEDIVSLAEQRAGTLCVDKLVGRLPHTQTW